ncbi:CLIP domain-containing serine protease B4-like [Palaemon carinicauda]|uniref:CLIP domain-containing serine protease B4-like n=1 Tax=Palaemon carinicauda TaxID=392227 RepID=UPI0035B6A111
MFSCITLFILLAGGGLDVVECQNVNSPEDIQSFLNQFCFPGSTNPGCSAGSIISPDSALPTPQPPSPPTPGPPSLPTSRPRPSSGCLPNERKCPQLPGNCVPGDFDCNLIGSITCPLPKAYGITTQVLLCGDGSRYGIRCGDDSNIPVLTLLLVQCEGNNAIEHRHIEEFSALNGPGDDGGAGVYRCSSSGKLERMLNSPSIENLIVSCRDAGCGRVPHPSAEMPVRRRWSWVRAIYKDDKLHCTGTLVSQNALVTAAHCVTKSLVSRDQDSVESYQIELPGPRDEVSVIKLQPSEIHVHPKYSPIDGHYHHDMAVIFFEFNTRKRLPTVCISNRQYTKELGKYQVVFNMKDELPIIPSHSYWNVISASWDHTCLTTATRTSARCVDTVQVQASQYCAEHKGTSLSKGSSGGPYLAEMGQDLQETWVLMGVLSATAQITGDGCSQDHSVYGQVADEFRWLKDCVFDRKCLSS